MIVIVPSYRGKKTPGGVLYLMVSIPSLKSSYKQGKSAAVSTLERWSEFLNADDNRATRRERSHALSKTLFFSKWHLSLNKY